MVDLNQNEKMSYLFTAEKAGMQGLNREEINIISLLFRLNINDIHNYFKNPL